MPRSSYSGSAPTSYSTVTSLGAPLLHRMVLSDMSGHSESNRPRAIFVKEHREGGRLCSESGLRNPRVTYDRDLNYLFSLGGEDGGHISYSGMYWLLDVNGLQNICHLPSAPRNIECLFPSESFIYN